MRKPTEKQRRFLAAYLGEANGNATKAARIAGYAWPMQAGGKLVEKCWFLEAVNAAVARARMEAGEVLARLAGHAAGDMGDFLDIRDDGTFRIDLTKAAKAGKTHLIRGVRHWRTTRENVVIEVTELELHSSLDALETLAKHHGLYLRKNECPNPQPNRLRIHIPGA